MSALSDLALVLSRIDPARIGARLADKAKDHALDTVGVAVEGANDARARTLAEVVLGWGGAPRARVFWREARLPAPKAAYLNTLQARVLTFDDTFDAGPIHPGSVVLSAALATAERVDADGGALLAGLLAGYEAMTRVALALGQDHYARGFHATGTCAPFGAAAAAARVLGLDGPGTAAALALAGGGAVGYRQYQDDGSMLDSACNAARGAELGVAAAELAAAGARGPAGMLDGRWGVLAMLSAGPDPGALTDGLGERWVWEETALKPYASCRYTHAPVAELMASGLRAEEVASLEIATFRQSHDVSNRPMPQEGGEAILSHQLAAAQALCGRPLLPRDYADIAPEVRELARRVTVRHDPALDALVPELWPHRLTATLKAGGTRSLVADRPLAATREQARAKFDALAVPRLGAERAAEIASRIARMETLKAASEIADLLAPPLREAA